MAQITKKGALAEAKESGDIYYSGAMNLEEFKQILKDIEENRKEHWRLFGGVRSVK